MEATKQSEELSEAKPKVVRIIYDPILRTKVAPVTVFDEALKKEAAEMIEVMKSHDGLGLAANQVGLDKQFFVCGYHRQGKDDPLPEIPFAAFANPNVIKVSKEKDTATEGCLSLPGLELPVTRPSGITLEVQSLDGQPVTIKAKGFLARLLQHETDHLNGILFTDHVANYKNLADYKFAKILFCGSDDFSARVLQELIASGLTVVAAITETSKRAGRGDQVVETPITKLADENGIAVFQPADKDEITEITRQISPDLLILASYGKILPAETLLLPKYGCLNVHPSMLPKYRGATPIQTSILNGDIETGVTIMTMVPAVDAGGIVAQEKTPIKLTDTTETLRAKLAEQGARLLVKSLPTYLAGQAKIQPQDPSAATKTTKLTKEMGKIDWSKSAVEIDREIRAFTPWPGSFTDLNGQRLKILAAYLERGKLKLKTVQLEGKKPADWEDFKRGYASQLTRTNWFSKIT